ncbi:MAG: SdpI family protein [Oscillospiraceae bacterium]|nr:SdpI family protein [Oscillospiraceae bacterium]
MVFIYFHMIEAVLAAVFLIFGFIYLKKPPEYGNGLGFSTKLSRKDKEHWALAQTYAALLLLAYGAVLAIAFVLINFALPLGRSIPAMLVYYAIGAVFVAAFVPLTHALVRSRIGKK